MNPYLEQDYDWHEFHSNFVVQTQRYLYPLVGSRYIVKTETRLILHAVPEDERRFFAVADVGVARPGVDDEGGVATATVDAPVLLDLPNFEVEKTRYLRIVDKENRRVVTTIELLSPSNKKGGTDRDVYLAKRNELFRSEVHFVEIDLRRWGVRPAPPELPSCDYYALVSPHEDRPRVGLWPFGLRDPLPSIPIPLRAPDLPVMLNLKAVLDEVYDATGFGNHIYQQVPDPPLNAVDAAWAHQILDGAALATPSPSPLNGIY
jgi:hypothetical protein